MEAIKISIPQPCHENWQQMTPTDKGRFCKACAKEVVDFSRMTDEEVLGFFAKKSDSNVCGRVMPQQLNRNITKPVTISQKVTWYWKYLVASILLFAKTPAKAQSSKIGKIRAKPHVEQNCNNTAVAGGMTVRLVENNVPVPVNTIFKGKVVNENGVALPGASIQLKGTNRGAMTDTAGDFTIAIHKDSSKIIAVSYAGYQTREVLLSAYIDNNVIVLYEFPMLLGDIVITTHDPVKQKPIAQMSVANKNSKDQIANAFITIQKNSTNFKKVYTNAAGIADIEKINKIDEEDAYIIKISAKGYKDYEFKMNGREFIEKEPLQKIYLTPEKKLLNSINIIKATPNPIAKGTSFTIDLKLASTGNYFVQIINTEGNIVVYTPVQATSKNFTLAMLAAANWGSGIYFIKLINSNAEMIAQDSFMVQ